LAVVVTEANLPERLGGAAVVMEAAEATENLVLIWVDQGFSGENESTSDSTIMRGKSGGNLSY
jgi:hypothetical protein